ncbi:protein SGT1 homolog isoform X1 [Symphalangus syndactylus]|uniref:protein SGT1 homolog isoform X1 n=1 Tax=Symphalangus syndactylus TaxID=9590 RepID=UPI002441614D|nr:protein SGT1 homolog isoform X2 [Symphalangus syndactylus]
MAPRPLSLGRVPASALADAARLPTLSELTKALEQKPDDAQYYRQRAYCHILLGNYCVAVADAKKSPEFNRNNSTDVLRKGYAIATLFVDLGL